MFFRGAFLLVFFEMALNPIEKKKREKNKVQFEREFINSLLGEMEFVGFISDFGSCYANYNSHELRNESVEYLNVGLIVNSLQGV